jgi:predicted DCC family thiol-disulfide oxidoreductase YuxK
MAPCSTNPIILYDGVCNLCNSWVRFVIRHDREGRFRFAPQQSAHGQALISEYLPDGANLSTVILFTNDRVYTKSAAVIEIAAQLEAPWRWLAALRLIPRQLSDLAYLFIVRHRYRWFGRTDTCQIPAPDTASRFIA